MAPTYDLAELNIARLAAPLDDPQIADFVAALEPINGLADSSPGFRWRFQTEEGDATSVRPFSDDLIIVNLSTWASIEALADYVYRSDHAAFLRRRREWFDRMAEAWMVLWWVPAGHRPTVDEALDRLHAFRADGPTEHAFSFRKPFAPPASGAPEGLPSDDRWTCPA